MYSLFPLRLFVRNRECRDCHRARQKHIDKLPLMHRARRGKICNGIACKIGGMMYNDYVGMAAGERSK